MSLRLRLEGIEIAGRSEAIRPYAVELKLTPAPSGRRGSRTLKAHRSTVFETAAIANWLALPIRSAKAAVAGIEPAIVSLNRRRPTVWPHRKMSREAGFEPAISSSPSLRNSRLRYTLPKSAWSISNRRSPAPEAGGFPNFPTRRLNKSTQRESNPHVRHGKAVGCRYIMGAMNPDRIVKEREHRVGLEPTLPRHECGILAAG